MNFEKKGRVYVVESFRDVKNIFLFMARLVEAVGKVTEVDDPLSLTATAAKEAVLEVGKYVIRKVDYRAI